MNRFDLHQNSGELGFVTNEDPVVQMAMSNDIEACENEPVLPYLDDCETVENLPVLL